MEHLVERMLKDSGLSASALARRSGVSRSSQFRIETGAVDPGLGTLRELALAAGFDLNVELAPLSDPDAARAARVILDEGYDPSPSRAVSDWVARLKRWVSDGDPVEIVRVAGISSSLLKRRGSSYLTGQVDDLKLASAGASSGAPWLLSGSGVLSRMQETGDGPVAGPYIVYTGDMHRFLRVLDNMTPARPEKALVVVTEYSVDLESDIWGDGPLRMVAPIQALIDGFGIGGELAEAAERTARGW